MKLIAGSYERFLWGWQVRAKSSQLELAISYPAHLGPIKSIAACGTLVATGGSDDTIKVFNVSTQEDMGSLYLHTGAVTCLDFFRPQESSVSRPTHLFSGSEDGSIGVWDTESWSHLKSMRGHKTALNSLSVHKSGKVALSVERDGHMKMWNLLNGRCTFTTKLASEASIIKFSPQAGESYSVARGESLEIFNVVKGILIHSFEHEKRILCLAQNQDDLIRTGGEDKIIRAWDTRSGNLALSVPNAHSNRIRGVCILNSPESIDLPHLIASCSSDGSVRIWDTRMNQSLQDKTSPAFVFETTTKSRLTCLVSCGSARKLESISKLSSQNDHAVKKGASDGNGDSNTVTNGRTGKTKKRDAFVQVEEMPSQGRKKKKKKGQGKS